MSGVEQKAEEGPTPRLTISKMVFENFKSYAGVREIGPFHKNFSSIVGPNGSGKSNVIDGLLFVFGRRAKQIRLNKLGELVHKSNEHTGLTTCKVSVHFQDIIDTDDDGFEVVPNSEIIITRTATIAGVSKYYINGKVCREKDVSTLLGSKGIDLDNNRFLILQGEVEQIAMMKPRSQTKHDVGLLEYLEDIIGSDKYIEDIDAAFQEVEVLNDQRQEKLNRVKISEKEKDSLEGAKTEAEEYLRQEVAVVHKQGILAQVMKAQCEKTAEEVVEKKNKLQEKLDYEQEKLKTHNAELKEMEVSCRKMNKEYEKVKDQCAQTKKEFNSYERKDIKYREDVKHEKAKIKKGQAAVKRQAKKKKELQKEIEAGKQNLPNLQKRLERLTKAKEEQERKLDQIYESVKGKIDPIRTQMEAKQKSLIPLRSKVNEVQQEISVRESEVNLYTEKTETAQKKLAETEEQLEAVRREISSKKAQFEKLNVGLRKSEQSLKTAQEELEELVSQESKVKDHRQKLMSKTEEAKAAHAMARDRGALLENLMKAKKKGVVPGVQGRLGDLGTIADKYDVSISTACSSLNDIVVDTTTTGQKCVEILRKYKLGRANFILMDKMEHLRQRMEQPISTPENVPRLFDLVKPKNDSFRPAFYYALRDTIVADNLDQAVRIANQGRRWRVVTLQGQLIDTSGTMSGGGTRQKRGGMSSKFASADADDVVDAKEISQMERQLEIDTQSLESIRSQRSRLEAKVAALKKAVDKLQVDVQKMKMDLDSAENSKKELKQRVSQLQKGTSLTAEEEDKVRALKKELKHFHKALAEANRNTESLEAEVSALENKILEAGGSKLRLQKSKIEESEKEMEELSKDINKIEFILDNNEKKIVQCEKAIEKSEKEIEKCQTSLDKLSEDVKSIEEAAFDVLNSYKQAEELLKTKESEMDELQKEFDSRKKVVAKIRSVEVDIANQMEDYGRIIADNETKLKHWEYRIEKARKKIADAISMFGDDVDSESSPEDKKDEQEAVDGMDVDTDEAAKPDEEKEDDVDEEEEDAAPPSRESMRFKPFELLSEDELSGIDIEQVKYDITMLEEQLQNMKPNMSAIEEYRKKEREYASRVRQLDAVSAARNEQRKKYEGLRKQRLDMFMSGFSVITLKLKEMYQMLTLGGDAELELVDSLDPFSEGIVFSVRPPKKSWKNIQNLSGGEKTLSSLALVFALHHFKPTPLYVMDEIDAALDFKNVSIVANYIKERTKNAQFVIISLRNNMFELADRLVGIYKTFNCTKSITIDPRNFTVPGKRSEDVLASTATTSVR